MEIKIQSFEENKGTKFHAKWIEVRFNINGDEKTLTAKNEIDVLSIIGKELGIDILSITYK